MYLSGVFASRFCARVLVAKVQEALEHQLTHRMQQGIARMLLLCTACRQRAAVASVMGGGR